MVAVILKATLDYPALLGLALSADIKKWGQLWAKTYGLLLIAAEGDE